MYDPYNPYGSLTPTRAAQQSPPDVNFGPAFPDRNNPNNTQMPSAQPISPMQGYSAYSNLSGQQQPGLFSGFMNNTPAMSQFFGQTNAAGYGAGDPGMNFGAAGNQSPGFWQGLFGASEGAGGAAGGGAGGSAAGGGAAGGSAAGGAGGGMWSSAGSSGPVGAMIIASLLGQYAGQSAFEPGSTGGKMTDALMPTLTGNIDFDDPGNSNWGNLGSQALGLGPIGAFVFPRDEGSENEGTMVFGK